MYEVILAKGCIAVPVLAGICLPNWSRSVRAFLRAENVAERTPSAVASWAVVRNMATVGLERLVGGHPVQLTAPVFATLLDARIRPATADSWPVREAAVLALAAFTQVFLARPS